MIATLSVLIENICKRCIVLLAQWYTNLCHLTENSLKLGRFRTYIKHMMAPITRGMPNADRVHPSPPISSSLRLLVLFLVRPDLFVLHYCLFIFFKEISSFIGFLEKFHTSVFQHFDYNASDAY